MWDSNRSSVQRYRRTGSGAFFHRHFPFFPTIDMVLERKVQRPHQTLWTNCSCSSKTQPPGGDSAVSQNGFRAALFGNTYSSCCKLAQLPYLRCNRPRGRDSVCKVPVVGRSLGCSEKSRRAVSPAHSKGSGVFVGNCGGQQCSVTTRTGPQSRGDRDIKQGCREGPRINPLMSHPMDGGSENL